LPAAFLRRKGPALLFESIKGYRSGRCTKVFVSGLGAQSRLALALGFPRDVANRELIQYVMKKNRETIAPLIVRTGPVKDIIVRGEAIDQTEFAPLGNLRERRAIRRVHRLRV
jgi:4-hydroxy-3-polyprenylbenzoate decarboxylase